MLDPCLAVLITRAHSHTLLQTRLELDLLRSFPNEVHTLFVHSIQRPDGSFMLGEPWDAADEDASPAVGEAMISRARELIPALDGATVESVHVALRCGVSACGP